MSAAWTPQPAGVAQIADLLLGGTSFDNAVQHKVQHDLHHLGQTVPDFACYLAYLLAPVSAARGTQLRSMAGYALKAYLLTHAQQLPPQVLDYVKAALLETLSDADRVVTNVAGTVISTLLSKVHIHGWPESLHKLIELIRNPSSPSFMSAVAAIAKICEDDAEDLIYSPMQPLTALLPALIALVSGANEPAAIKAIHCMANLIHADTAVIEDQYPAFLGALFGRALDQSPGMRQAVCTCIVRLIEFRPEKLEPQLEDVIQYMLACTQADDPGLALEACEFWIAIADHAAYFDTLEAYLPQLVATFLTRMVYSEEELADLGAFDQDDTHVPDAVQDVKPRHVKSKQHEAGSKASPGGAEDGGAKSDDDANEDDDDDDGEDDPDSLANAWTLRKCAAAALDALATIYEERILPPLLPQLQTRLASPEWLQREAGILALGAVAEGAIDGIEPHLPQLVPFLLSSLNDVTLVRNIACWALGRFATWIVEEPAGHAFFVPLLQGLLQNCAHGNKRVQESACSALATVMETAGNQIVPHLGTILPALVHCFSIYQHNNLMNLYDCIGTLAEAAGNALNTPEFAALMLPPLFHQWHKLADTDRNILPLFECMGSVVIALGAGFAPHANEVYERCLRIVSAMHQALVEYQRGAIKDEPDRDFFIVSLDLMGAVVGGLGPSAEAVVARYLPGTMAAVTVAMEDPSPHVKQSALGLFGDLVVNTFRHVQPHAAELLNRAIPLIKPFDEMSWQRLCNNATWVCAELTDKMGAEMAAKVPDLVAALLPLIGAAPTPRDPPPMIVENAVLCLGRLGHADPHALAASGLEKWAGIWLTHMVKIGSNAEKEAALTGFLAAVRINPNACLRAFARLCDVLATYASPSPALDAQMREVVHGYRALVGDAQWPAYMQTLAPPIRTVVQHRFGV
ncbi:hypothetical protein GGF31_005192 [Allomyces arbusculus]|nr:hypothetical protein GGF31_005192 [Allomyces arbusculus]